MTKCNFAGDKEAGASWTDKIMSNKSDASSATKSEGHGEGADEEEWVRGVGDLRHDFFPLANF